MGVLGVLKRAAARSFPTQYRQLQYWQMYRGATAKVGNHLAERDRLFRAMIARSTGKPSMQIGVRGAKYAPHWVSVDLYDLSPLIDYHYDIMDMPFEDAKFDFVACIAVLEHVPYPEKAIAELTRVLKPGGEIWIEIPFNQPYHPSPADYWRVSPDGMRIWMRAFDEQALGLFAPNNSVIYNGIFFHGVKPARS